MNDAATSPAIAPHGRRTTILAYASSVDGSTIEFEIEWSGYLHRWVIVDAYNDVLVEMHRKSSQA